MLCLQEPTTNEPELKGGLMRRIDRSAMLAVWAASLTIASAVAENYSCQPTSDLGLCNCRGTSDCIDMRNSGMCAGTLDCKGTGAQMHCTCLAAKTSPVNPDAPIRQPTEAPPPTSAKPP
jgi:hypothetical protein